MLAGKIKTTDRGTTYLEVEGNIIAKKCTKCEETKTIGMFHNDTTGFLKTRSECRNCRNDKRKIGYSKRKEVEIQRKRDYVEANKEKVTASRRSHYVENRELEINRTLNWKENNPDKVRINKHNREAKKNGLPNNLTEQQYIAMMEHFNHSCALTGEKIDIHLDHFIPLSSGHGGTTFKNMIPLRADLNVSKNGSNPIDWFNNYKALYNLEEDKFNHILDWLSELNGMSQERYLDYIKSCFISKL